MIEDDIMGKLYQKFPITVENGVGITITDDKGKKYIDCMSGYGVALVGHNNQIVVNAIKSQLNKIITVHNSLYNKTREEFLSKLVNIAPTKLSHIYLSNSGSEAIEAAIKFARKFTKKKGMVAMIGSYHGKTLGALSLTFNLKYRRSFQPLIDNVVFSPLNNIQSLRSIINNEIGCIIIEPIQGENGIHVANYSFLQETREICNKLGILLIFDEIQSGLGRTGKMWACEHANTFPDIMCLAKGIAGGLPMGATLVRKEILECINKGEHSSTFGGNPLSCAAGNAIIETIVKKNLVENARIVGKELLNRLIQLKEKYKIIREIRGKGLMIGIEMKFDIKDILMDGLKHGILLLYSGRNTLRLLPPLILTEKNITKIIEILDTLFMNEEKRKNV